MTWHVSVGERVRRFLKDLTVEEFTEVSACIKLLESIGPSLPRPHSGTLRDSEHANLKELRVPYKGKQFRILYAFDTERCAILLVAGDKVPLGEKRWYAKYIAEADELYKAHEADLTAKRLKLKTAEKANKAKKGKGPKR